jgi:hypothetical protein
MTALYPAGVLTKRHIKDMMEGVRNTPMTTDARAKYHRVSRQTSVILPLFGRGRFPDSTDGFNNTNGCNGVPGRMSGNQPGNSIGYGMVPPFLPAMIHLKGTAGLHKGSGRAKVDYLIGYFLLASHRVYSRYAPREGCHRQYCRYRGDFIAFFFGLYLGKHQPVFRCPGADQVDSPLPGIKAPPQGFPIYGYHFDVFPAFGEGYHCQKGDDDNFDKRSLVPPVSPLSAFLSLLYPFFNARALAVSKSVTVGFFIS